MGLIRCLRGQNIPSALSKPHDLNQYALGARYGHRCRNGLPLNNEACKDVPNYAQNSLARCSDTWIQLYCVWIKLDYAWIKLGGKILWPSLGPLNHCLTLSWDTNLQSV